MENSKTPAEEAIEAIPNKACLSSYLRGAWWEEFTQLTKSSTQLGDS